MEFKEKLMELEKCIETKLRDFERDTGMQISYIGRAGEKGFKLSVRLDD